MADGSSAGYAKAKSEVSFEEFSGRMKQQSCFSLFKVVGMAWEAKGEGTGKVLVAVGVK